MNYYQILELQSTATHQEIKQAYRRLVKKYHPDTHPEISDTQKIVQLNQAYEILSDPHHRQSYDRQLNPQHTAYSYQESRHHRTQQAQQYYQQQKVNYQQEDQQELLWVKNVYVPIQKLFDKILKPLKKEINALSADPFDDNLMTDFSHYLIQCRLYLKQAERLFSSQANPPKYAKIALNIYYSLNHLSDALEELEWFTQNYDEHYLNTGKELFKRVQELRS